MSDLDDLKAKSKEDWEHRKTCHAIGCRDLAIGKDLLCREHIANLGVYEEAYTTICQTAEYVENDSPGVDFGFTILKPKYKVLLDKQESFQLLAIQNHLRVIDLEKELKNSRAQTSAAESSAHYHAGQVSRLRNL